MAPVSGGIFKPELKRKIQALEPENRKRFTRSSLKFAPLLLHGSIQQKVSDQLGKKTNTSNRYMAGNKPLSDSDDDNMSDGSFATVVSEANANTSKSANTNTSTKPKKKSTDRNHRF